MSHFDTLGDTPIIVLRASIRDRSVAPRYYAGGLPLDYQAYCKCIGATSIPQSHYVMVMKFADFHTVFEYDKGEELIGVASRAKTYSEDKRLLAEAVLVTNKMEGAEIAEVHYSATGQPAFRCKSAIDNGLLPSQTEGHKTDERDAEGVKTRDYYFMWPVRLE